MKKQSKRRSWPIPDAESIKGITFRLDQVLKDELEVAWGCCDDERKPWEVTTSARDGAVHVLRFFRMWFDLPQEVFFAAASYLDMFLARMQVQEKYLPCLLVSCFGVAAASHGCEINTSHLVVLSQSKCSVKDVERMSTIITKKLNLGKSANDNRNPFDLLTIYMDIFQQIAKYYKCEGLLGRMLQWEQLCTRLEVLVCDSSCVDFKPSTLVLAFIHFEVERFLSREVPKKSNYYSLEMFYVLVVMIELRSLCNINPNEYASCFERVTNVLKEYDSRKRTGHSQKLIWRFSISTHAFSRFTQNYYSALNTIKEE